MNIRKLTLVSILTAMTALLTLVYHVPVLSTSGYVHFGDSIIYLAAFMVGPGGAAVVGALGGVIADLLVSPVYAIPTLIIKAAMGGAAGAVYAKMNKGKAAAAVSFLAGGIILTAGYYVTDSLLYGSFVSATATIPFNIAQFVASIPIPCIIITVLKRRNVNL